MAKIKPIDAFNIVAVDPSVNNVGISFAKFNPQTKEVSERSTKLVKPRGSDLEQTARNLINAMRFEFASLQIHTLVLEYPEFFSSMKGAVAATQGFTLDLAYICGRIAGEFSKAKTVLYTPSQWKGQQPKKAIEFKFNRLFGKWKGWANKSEHEQEATMMLNKHLQLEYGYQM